jgi:hypothetical protein
VRIAGDQFTAVPRTVAEVPTVPQVHLADIRLVAEATGSGHGVATFDLLPAGLTECVLVLPDNCHLTQVAVEGVPGRVERMDTDDRRWRVMLCSATLPQRIDVLFAATATRGKSWRAPREWHAPMLHVADGAIEVRQTLWTFHAARSRHRAASGDATRVSRASQELARFENAASLLNLPREIADEVPDGERLRWARGWARRLLVSRDQLVRDTGRHADAQVTPSRIQALVAGQVDNVGGPSAGAGFEHLTTDAAAAREPAELLALTVPHDAPTERFVYPGARAWIDEAEWEPFPAGPGDRLAAAGLLGVVISIMVIAVHRGWYGDALWRWPQLIGVAAGLAWWLWLSPSLMGWALIALVAIWTYRRRRPCQERFDRADDAGQQIVVS